MDKRRFTPRFSYPLPNKPSIPIEAILKTGFPLIGKFTTIQVVFFLSTVNKVQKILIISMTEMERTDLRRDISISIYLGILFCPKRDS